MAIIAALQRHTGRYSDTRDGEVSYTEHYIVRDTTGAAITALQIRASAVLPTFNTKLMNSNAYLQTRTLDVDRNDPSIWYARCEYKTREQTESSDDPLKFNAVVEFDTVPMSYVVDRAYDTGDAQGSPSLAVRDTADSAFDPPLTGERQLDLIIIEKNYSSFNPSDAKKFRDTINKGAMTIGGIPVGDGEGWMRQVKLRTQFKTDGTAYDRVRFEVLVNEENWNRKPLSQGYYQYTGGDTAKKNAITEADISSDGSADNAVTEPQRLAANGSLLAPTAAPYFMNYQDKYKLGWRDLNLPVRKDGRV